MRAVRDYGTPLVEDPARLEGVRGLGVDEHVWAHAGPRRRTGFATGIVDLSPGRAPRLLDLSCIGLVTTLGEVVEDGSGVVGDARRRGDLLAT